MVPNSIYDARDTSANADDCGFEDDFTGGKFVGFPFVKHLLMSVKLQ
jgi:hypothetical protein